MSRTLRYLRITFSAPCGIICLLLIALWVRSYWWADELIIKLPNPQRQFQIHSTLGGTIWYCNDYPRSKPAWTHEYWRVVTYSVAALTEGVDVHWFRPLFTFKFFSLPAEPYWSRQLVFPHWVLITAFMAVAAAPWIRWRFSLRTLLIAITLLALTLGTIIATTR
jgi:hypothetical protein